MGDELIDTEAEAAAVFAAADEILGFDFSRIVREGPLDVLTETKYAQPAILTHSVALHTVLRECLGTVSMAAGHSLGEFSAHVAAGTLSFEDALRAVRLRGELMHGAGEERPGTMAAILGLDDEGVVELCREASAGPGTVVAANFNAPGQVVISGDPEAVERAISGAKEAGAKRTIPLNVSGAFHSPLMAPAEEGLREYLEGITFHDPAFPVVSNVTAEPISSGDEARELLVRQLTAPVRWAESVRRMVEVGVERTVELGPGRVLCGLTRRIDRDLRCTSIEGPGGFGDLDDKG